MALAADDHMVVQQDVELLQRRRAGLGDGDVLARGRRIARGVVVQRSTLTQIFLSLS
jgi:hypothetical protein